MQAYDKYKRDKYKIETIEGKTIEEKKAESLNKQKEWQAEYDNVKKAKHSKNEIRLRINNIVHAEIGEEQEKWLIEYKKNIEKIDAKYSHLKDTAEIGSEEKEIFEKKQEESSNRLRGELDIVFEKYHDVGLHAEHERLLANLYALFSKIFPNDELWPFMTEEERKHESWLNTRINFYGYNDQ